MSNPSGPPDPNNKSPMGATGASCNPKGTTFGNVTVNPAPNFPGNWVTIPIPSSGWGFMGGFIPHPDSKEAKKKDNRDGCDCKKCKEFYPYAEPNQEDGTLVCYKCRMGW